MIKIFGSNTKIALQLSRAWSSQKIHRARWSQLNKKFQGASGNKYCDNMVPFSDMAGWDHLGFLSVLSCKTTYKLRINSSQNPTHP